jgi:hypothetical protein
MVVFSYSYSYSPLLTEAPPPYMNLNEKYQNVGEDKKRKKLLYGDWNTL